MESPAYIRMALTLYGSPRSRTMRVLWMAAELDLEFEHVPLEWNDPALKTPAFLALNPSGAIPTLVDDGFALSESLAINLYLAKRYSPARAGGLYPRDAGREAQVWRWSLWAQGHLEPWVQKDELLAPVLAAIGDRADAMVDVSLAALARHLEKREWLVGDGFSVGDLNVAGVLSPSRARQLDLSGHQAVVEWLGRCYSRPAAVATRLRFSS